MRKVLMIMFMTLDGVAEFPVYETDASHEEADPMWSPRMKKIDTIILGATSYKKWFGYWPHRATDPKAGPWEKEFARFADAAQKVVFSKKLASAEWKNSKIVRGDPSAEVATLKSLPGKDMALGGGPRLAQAFLERGLVDEMLLEVFPSLVGRGKPMFRVRADPDNPEDEVKIGVPGRHDFRLLDSKPFRNGTLFLHYAKAS